MVYRPRTRVCFISHTSQSAEMISISSKFYHQKCLGREPEFISLVLLRIWIVLKFVFPRRLGCKLEARPVTYVLSLTPRRFQGSMDDVPISSQVPPLWWEFNLDT
ncbi:hypothetical protein KEM48_008734 [Puccinia striiformis f. sp. tritici PST-130]|nr:hypothetical protein KEM48_008404 [Puccinia striiformis f. sp. tritici PST-130]KAI9624731.1 hypothetical protein KEM48_008734 [Puccinia striiformis f. sp. tritici PST-130]